jgi:hypothetical protein
MQSARDVGVDSEITKFKALADRLDEIDDVGELIKAVGQAHNVFSKVQNSLEPWAMANRRPSSTN